MPLTCRHKLLRRKVNGIRLGGSRVQRQQSQAAGTQPDFKYTIVHHQCLQYEARLDLVLGKPSRDCLFKRNKCFLGPRAVVQSWLWWGLVVDPWPEVPHAGGGRSWSNSFPLSGLLQEQLESLTSVSSRHLSWNQVIHDDNIVMTSRCYASIFISVKICISTRRCFVAGEECLFFARWMMIT